jgi:hypothetical protein
VAGEYVNLNDAGTLTRSGQGYDTTSDDNVAESRTFSGRMDASRPALRGSAGNAFSSIADAHSSNLTALARQIATQAMIAAGVDRVVIATDDEANSAQTSTLSTVDANSTAVNRPINANV